MFGIGSLANIFKPLVALVNKLTHSDAPEVPKEEHGGGVAMASDSKSIKTQTGRFEIPPTMNIQDIDVKEGEVVAENTAGTAQQSGSGNGGVRRPAAPRGNA